LRMMSVPILGMVENMSHHVCVNCGHIEHTFGKGGVRRFAHESGVDLLGEVCRLNISDSQALNLRNLYLFAFLPHVPGIFGIRYL
jgi:Mrp family chromosome partitioning ATPase